MSRSAVMRWLSAGAEIFPELLKAIAATKKSIQFETYIYADGRLGRQFLEALLAAAKRGVRVQVLIDAVGSWLLPDDFFHLLIAAGAEVRRFNPLHPFRIGVRDHRKLLICDQLVVFIGGFNLADEYDGDGITRGWCDLGVRIENRRLAARLGASFAELLALSDFREKSWLRFYAFKRRRQTHRPSLGGLLLTHPGRGASPFQLSLYRDLSRAESVQVVSPYFLPTHRLRRDLMRVSRRGGRVQLILAGKTDVLISQLAARSLYPRLLKAGIEIFEYQPQILHAKMICIDGVVYVGSSNLDIRSLNLNYELMLRLQDKSAAGQAQAIIKRLLLQSRKIELRSWRKTQTFWQRWKNHWAHFLLARIDPFLALGQFRSLRNNFFGRKQRALQ
ncbi:MAG: phosphatidylserine/phosphatidylglycerophosphate/cardiolipin synthase family protein [Verrucomicrobiota bacterium]